MRLTLLAVFAAIIGCSTPAVTQARHAGSARQGGWSVELVDEAGQVLPTFTHAGRTYVLGALGRRYFLRVRNDSGARVEVVASVDGRDVVDGAPAELGKRGYLVGPHDTLTIDGYRLSQDAVAAFRFSSVPRSYAALEGDPRDVGVIGVAVFRERELPRPRRLAERELRAEAAPRSQGASAGEAAPSAPAAEKSADASRRPGLGTEFGEEHASHVRLVSFERASARPDVVLTLRYDDRDGLLAAGVDLDGRRTREAGLRSEADPFRRNGGYARPPPGWSRGPSGG